MIPLKEAIKTKHKKAEEMPFNARMFKGLLSKNEYLLYLHQQLHVFSAIEKIGLPYAGLARKERVQEDINELIHQGCSYEVTLKSTTSYVNYLSTLLYEQLLPHIYLNYMGILFGGQMIKKAVPSTGKMYVFENMQEAVQAIRAVQRDDWAVEVNKGFDFNIDIFNELEVKCKEYHAAN